MVCPFCGREQIYVVNSRSTKSNSQIWRRKRCNFCHEIFTTYEKIDLSYLNVVKSTGRKQRYQRAKLFSGLYHAAIDAKNVNRGEMSSFTESLTNEVEGHIIKLKRKNIRSAEIAHIILSTLSKKAPDIFLRFIAYRNGNNPRKIRSYINKYLP